MFFYQTQAPTLTWPVFGVNVRMVSIIDKNGPRPCPHNKKIEMYQHEFPTLEAD